MPILSYYTMEEVQANLSNYNRLIQIIQNNRLAIYFLVLYFAMHLAGNTVAYLFNNPAFQCTYSSHKIEEKQACEHLGMCEIKNYYSLTAYLNLYCGENKMVRNMIKSTKGIGFWIGIISVGITSDRFGKKIILKAGIVFLNIWFVLILAGGIWNNHFLIFLSQFAYGIGSVITDTIAFIYITRFLQKKIYEKLTIGFYLTGTGFSLLIFGLITHVVTNWIILIIIASIPLMGLLIFSFTLQEDPYYLLETGRIDQCQEVIQYIGQINQSDENLITEQLKEIPLLHIDHERSTTEILEILKAIIGNFEILKLVFVLGIVYLASHLSEASFNFTAQQVGFSYQSNITLMGIASILGNITIIFVLDFENQRKRGFICVIMLQTLLSCLYLNNFLQDSKFLEAALLFLLKFLKNWGMNFFIRLKIDSLPKSYQATLSSLIALIGKTCAIVDPHIIQYESDHRYCVIVMNYLIKLCFGAGLLFFINEKYHDFKASNNYTQVGIQQEVEPSKN